MTPSTLVRAIQRPRPPFTFIGLSAFHLEREEKCLKPEVSSLKPKPLCVARQDDGSPCGLPARYVDFKRGGHVCFDHRPDRKQEALQLV